MCCCDASDRSDTETAASSGTPPAGARPARRALPLRLSLAALTAAAVYPAPAHALDGCLVLLCLAAPSWGAIPQCVPPIRQLFFDLARGRVFPSCGMSGPPNSGGHQWASAPDFCPPQYTRSEQRESGLLYSCDYSGAITVNVEGAPWTRTWWNFGGGTVTEFLPAARARLGRWDTRFDDDYAAWLAIQPATPPEPPPACPAC